MLSSDKRSWSRCPRPSCCAGTPEHGFDLLRGLPGEEQVRDRAADQGWVEVLDDLDCVVERLADGLRAAPDALLFEPL